MALVELTVIHPLRLLAELSVVTKHHRNFVCKHQKTNTMACLANPGPGSPISSILYLFRSRGDYKPAPDISTEELEHTLTSMKNGRCRNEFGLVAEMLKSGGDVMHTCIKELFNDVMQCDKPSRRIV